MADAIYCAHCNVLLGFGVGDEVVHDPETCVKVLKGQLCVLSDWILENLPEEIKTKMLPEGDGAVQVAIRVMKKYLMLRGETGFFCPKCGTVYPENEMRCLICNPIKVGGE